MTVDTVTDTRTYFFRGDDRYTGGYVGRALGTHADAADIQNPADHVLRKESSRSSRFTSFSLEVAVARKFTSASDNRCVIKVKVSSLEELESQGILRILNADRVFEILREGPRKYAKQAADVRTAMLRNCEILIEGQIPAELLERTN